MEKTITLYTLNYINCISVKPGPGSQQRGSRDERHRERLRNTTWASGFQGSLWCKSINFLLCFYLVLSEFLSHYIIHRVKLHKFKKKIIIYNSSIIPKYMHQHTESRSTAKEKFSITNVCFRNVKIILYYGIYQNNSAEINRSKEKNYFNSC